MCKPIAELRSVSKHYFGVTAVADVSLRLFPGEALCLLGENGAGKSTLIKILTGVEQPTRGEILLDGQAVHLASPRDARARGVATVYQEIGTLPLMSVGRNFVLGAEPTTGRGLLKRMDTREANRLAIAEMQRLGIRRIRDGGQLVGTLSGGERQAVAIGRAVHFGARVLVLDEPTAALGVRESATVLSLIQTVRRQGVAILFITHNAYHASLVGDRFLIMRRGEKLAEFAKGEKTVEEIMSLMAGGDELSGFLAD